MPLFSGTKLILEQAISARLAFPQLPVHFDITLSDVKVTPEGDKNWITGNIEIKAGAAGADIDKTIPFKTLNDVETSFDIPGVGGSIDLKAVLKDPHQVCASAKLNWGIFHPSTGEHCTAI